MARRVTWFYITSYLSLAGFGYIGQEILLPLDARLALLWDIGLLGLWLILTLGLRAERAALAKPARREPK